MDEEVSYVHKYSKLRGRTDSELWSIRKTSVYTSINHQTKHSCCIILHLMYGSKAEDGLKEEFCA